MKQVYVIIFLSLFATTYGYSQITLPGTIEAESFTAQSGVEIATRAESSGGEHVKEIHGDDWMEYEIVVPEDGGIYEFGFAIAQWWKTAKFDIQLGGSTIGTGLEASPPDGNLTSFGIIETTKLFLPGGSHTMRITQVETGVKWSLDYIEVNAVPSTTLPKANGVIQAEDYDNLLKFQSWHMQTEDTNGLDTDGSPHVKAIFHDEWIEYAVNVEESGYYDIDVRVATEFKKPVINITAKGTNVGAVITSATNAYDTFETFSAKIYLSAGTQFIRFTFEDEGQTWIVANFNWFELTPIILPTTENKIEAEDYFAEGYGAGTEDADGGTVINYIDTDEWTEYLVNNTNTEGFYKINIRASAGSGDQTISISSDGDVKTSVDVTANGFANYETFTSEIFTLPPGDQTIRLTYSGGVNVNWFDFTYYETDPNPPYVAPNAWINEIHYDKVSAGDNEFVEIVIENIEDLNLDDFSLYFYDGADGKQYLSGEEFIKGDKDSIYTFYTYNANAGEDWILNENAGIALVHEGNVIQFISYDGTFEALDGPAEGMISTDMGVSQKQSPQDGWSLQLVGQGYQYNEFYWIDPPASPGSINQQQVFGPPPSVVPFKLSYLLFVFGAISLMIVYRRIR
ncbi:MAG: carbohydrate-binding protein [Prolixibacteraceae bacterium]|nr:carbohydrate-binding protein [Prolixibacteraceae bacterium]